MTGTKLFYKGVVWIYKGCQGKKEEHAVISDLVAYIENARQQGFALGEIRSHLAKYGWNDYLIDYAISQVVRQDDRKWLQGSVMAVMLIVLASAGTVWWIHSPESLPSCLLESPQDSMSVLTQSSACCALIPKYSCVKGGSNPEIRDSSGKVIFAPQVSCRTAQGMLWTTKRVLEGCAKSGFV